MRREGGGEVTNICLKSSGYVNSFADYDRCDRLIVNDNSSAAIQYKLRLILVIVAYHTDLSIFWFILKPS